MATQRSWKQKCNERSLFVSLFVLSVAYKLLINIFKSVIEMINNSDSLYLPRTKISCTKGLFTLDDTVAVFVRIIVNVYHCVNGENLWQQNGLYIHSVCQSVHQKRSKVCVSKA